MSKDKKANEVAVPQGGPVTMVETAPAFDADAGAGFEGAGREDMAIPFLAILQSGSPQCKRSEGAYIEGAAEGMLLNTVTGKVIDTHKAPLQVIPCAYTRAFVEWRLRENGGGFVREHAPNPALLDGAIRDEKNRDVLPNGNQMNDTRTFYVLVLDEDGVPSPAVITMTSTQIKKSKQWLMQQNLLKLRGAAGNVYTPPMFASTWTVTTVPESNEKGSWMGWKFEHAGYLAGPADPLYLAAKAFHTSIASGETRVDMSKANVDPETGEVRTGGEGQADETDY
jgi:hypothetical protein